MQFIIIIIIIIIITIIKIIKISSTLWELRRTKTDWNSCCQMAV